MIPRHLSLVPVNPFQLASLQAILEVEERRQRGQYSYAVALLRQLRGGSAGRITARDVKRAAPNYCPNNRGGEPKERYLEALDRLIESRGDVCPLPLSGCAVGQYFPDAEHRLRERRFRQQDARSARKDRREDKVRKQTRRRYQTAVAQAGIELAFVTPSALEAWFDRQEKRGIDDDSLVEMVHAWGQQFTGLQGRVFRTGQPLWAMISDARDVLTERSESEQWLDSLMLPNRLAKAG
jgi:hypothetical protein